MIVGIGLDVVDVNLFNKSLSKASFVDASFTPEEQRYADGKHQPLIHYAGMWAAKEATIKAVSSENLKISQIEVVRCRNGKPEVRVDVPLKVNIHVSITHHGTTAAATAIAEKLN